MTACCSPAEDAPSAGVGCPDRVKPQRSEPSCPVWGRRPTDRLDALASASERTELLDALQIRTGRSPSGPVVSHRGGAVDLANRRGDGAVAAVRAAGPGSGLPVGARGADAGRYRTVAPLNLFRAEPGGTGRTRPPRRPGAGRRRRLGILRHRAARYAAAVNEQFRHARGAVNAAAMSGPAVVGRDALGLFQPRVVIGWWRRAVVPHPTPDAEARRGCPPNRTW